MCHNNHHDSEQQLFLVYQQSRSKEITNKHSLAICKRYVFLDQVYEPNVWKKLLPVIKSMNICKMPTSKTQVNFDMQHNHTLCTSSNTQVCETMTTHWL